MSRAPTSFWRAARPRLRSALAACVLLAAFGALPPSSRAWGQDLVPVTVLDSPVAWQLFQQAEDQAKENPSEAARICQRLLDGYPDRVIPAERAAEGEDVSRYLGVAERVEHFLRTHPAVLERYRQVEGPEAERLAGGGPGQSAAESVAALRGMTSAGLRATLELAERDLFAGRFARVLQRLRRAEGHPDLAGDDGKSYWYLRGAAAALAKDPFEREQAEARLRALGLPDDAPEPAAIARFAAIEPLALPPMVSPLVHGIAPTEEELAGEKPSGPAGRGDASGWQPVWNEPLMPMSRLRFAQRGPFGEPMPTRLDNAALVVAPTVVGESVFLSNGHTVVALDRLSHRERWRRSLENVRIEAEPGPIADLASLAVGEGAVVTYPGHAVIGGRDTPGRVTCLDAERGEVRWEVPLAMLPGTEFDELFPIGAPAIGDGSVYCIARKLTSRFETVDYLLSFALDTGALRFATYIAGAGGVNVQGLRPATSPVVADGSVYVLSTAGAIARVDAGDGHIQWLQRFLVPVRAPRYQSEAWEMGGVALLGGSVFAVAPNLDTVVEIDRENGRTRNAMPTGVGSTWGTPRYLIAAPSEGLLPPRIFAVGGDVVAIDPDRPTQAVWTLSKVNEQRMADRDGATVRAGIRGRVQCAGSLLVVPGMRDVWLVARESGRVTERIEIDGPANPILVGPQLLLGMTGGAIALMPGQAAERLMRERIAKDPNDPEGGLALIDLGLRTKNIALSVEAAEAAKRAIEASEGPTKGSVASDQAREALVERLLAVIDLGQTVVTASNAEGPAPTLVASVDSAHALLAETVRTHAQQVRQLLAWSDWKAARKEWPAAIEAIDRIAADPALAVETVQRSEDVHVMALVAAVERLHAWSTDAASNLVERNVQASAALAAIDQGDAAKLAVFAASRPLTDAAIEAAIRSARVSIEGRSWNAAWATLQSALRTLEVLPEGRQEGRWDRESAAKLVAAAVDCARAAGWERSLAEFTDNMQASYGDLTLPLAQGETSLRALRSAQHVAAPAIGGTVAPIRELPGRVVRAASGTNELAAMHAVLMVEGTMLVLYRVPEFAKVWEVPIVDRDPIVLEMAAAGDHERAPAEMAEGGAILLWQAPGEFDQTASWIRLADGTTISSTPQVGALLGREAILETGRPVNQQMASGLPFIPAEVVPVNTSKEIVFVRRNGDAVGFDRRNLTAPIWTKRRLLDQVYEVDACDWGVALGGRAVPDPNRPVQRPNPESEELEVDDVGRGGDEGGPSAGVVIDPGNGATIGRVDLDAGGDPTWLELLETGELLVGAPARIVAFDLCGRLASQPSERLPIRWRRETVETHHSIGGWRVGDVVMLALDTELAEAIVPVDVSTADDVDGRFRSPVRLDERNSELRAGSRVGDAVLLRYRDRVVSFDLHGAVTGEDAVASEDRDYAAILEARDQVVVVSNGSPRQIPMSDGSGLRFEYNYTLYRLALADGLRLLGPGIRVRTVGQRAERWAIVDGFVIVSTNGGSLAVPMSTP